MYIHIQESRQHRVSTHQVLSSVLGDFVPSRPWHTRAHTHTLIYLHTYIRIYTYSQLQGSRQHSVGTHQVLSSVLGCLILPRLRRK